VVSAFMQEHGKNRLEKGVGMSVRPSEAEAILLAKRVASDAADRAEVDRSGGVHRAAAVFLWFISMLIFARYGRELASDFETSKPVVLVFFVFVGLLAHMAAEIAILQSKVASLGRLLQSAHRDD
jgi:hypothetical protein